MFQFKEIILLFLLFVWVKPANCQGTSGMKAGNDSILKSASQDETILYNMINDMRRENKLSLIPFSYQLSFVAHVHIDDLIQSKPQDKGCSLQGWSKSGKWSPCCNTKDAAGIQCMKSKPKEIAAYPGNGYELIYWGEEKAIPGEALDLWQQLTASSEMILNRGKWKGYQWKAIGVGIKEGYAILWLGDKPDKTTSDMLPKNSTAVKKDSAVVVSQSDVSQRKENETGKPGNAVKQNEVSDKEAPINPPGNKSGTKYYLVVMSLKNAESADSELARIKSMGYPGAFILKSETGYRIALASYDTPQKAASKARELKSEFPTAWVLKE
ncbi:MAG: SPOR domain-containing protein [Bacteroidota bacterium]